MNCEFINKEKMCPISSKCEDKCPYKELKEKYERLEGHYNSLLNRYNEFLDGYCELQKKYENLLEEIKLTD